MWPVTNFSLLQNLYALLHCKQSLSVHPMLNPITFISKSSRYVQNPLWTLYCIQPLSTSTVEALPSPSGYRPHITQTDKVELHLRFVSCERQLLYMWIFWRLLQVRCSALNINALYICYTHWLGLLDIYCPHKPWNGSKLTMAQRTMRL